MATKSENEKDETKDPVKDSKDGGVSGAAMLREAEEYVKNPTRMKEFTKKREERTADAKKKADEKRAKAKEDADKNK
jgi:hypothetical protein